MMRRENERFSFKRKYSYKDKVRRITKQRVTNVCLYRPIPTNYPIFFFNKIFVGKWPCSSHPATFH